MDKSQLITIAVTAVVSVIAKEVVTWGVASFRNTAAMATISAKLRAIFNKTNLRILLDLLAISVYVYMLAQVGWQDGPASGKDVLIIIGALVGTLFMVISLLVHIGDAMPDPKRLTPGRDRPPPSP